MAAWLMGAERSSGVVVDRIADARRELLAGGQVDWTGPAAAAYAAMLRDTLGRMTGLRHAAEGARSAVHRHIVAVDAVRAP